MSPESLLAEKLAAYRSRFDEACRGLFEGGEGVTLEYEDDDDGAVDVTSSAPADAASASGAASPQASRDAAAVKDEIRAALRWIAEDFAHEFNAKLAEAVRSDPTVELVAPKYEMGPGHTSELEEVLAAPIAPLVTKLDAGDLDGARRATLEVWPLLERRVRTKWQAYFVLTFQDVSVERKAARDRQKHAPARFDPDTEDRMARAEATRRSMSDFGAPEEAPRTRSSWIAVTALLLLAVAGGWLLIHRAHEAATAASSSSGAARP